MKGFLINVYNKSNLLDTGIFYPVAVKYRGHSHIDPLPFTPFCYGDHPENKTGLKGLEIGDALIFHTTLFDSNETQRYIIGGMVVGSINLVKNLSSSTKERYTYNPHIFHNDEEATFYYNCKSLFPWQIRQTRRILYLRPPLPFNKPLANALDLNIQWKPEHTPYQQIAWSTRAVRKVSSDKVELLKQIARRNYEEKERNHK